MTRLSSNSLSSSPSVSNISVASESGRVVGVRGDIMGYVFARENGLPPTSLGETGDVACIAVKAMVCAM